MIQFFTKILKCFENVEYVTWSQNCFHSGFFLQMFWSWNKSAKNHEKRKKSNRRFLKVFEMEKANNSVYLGFRLYLVKSSVMININDLIWSVQCFFRAISFAKWSLYPKPKQLENVQMCDPLGRSSTKTYLLFVWPVPPSYVVIPGYDPFNGMPNHAQINGPGIWEICDAIFRHELPVIQNIFEELKKFLAQN